MQYEIDRVLNDLSAEEPAIEGPVADVLLETGVTAGAIGILVGGYALASYIGRKVKAHHEKKHPKPAPPEKQFNGHTSAEWHTAYNKFIAEYGHKILETHKKFVRETNADIEKFRDRNPKYKPFKDFFIARESNYDDLSLGFYEASPDRSCSQIIVGMVVVPEYINFKDWEADWNYALDKAGLASANPSDFERFSYTMPTESAAVLLKSSQAEAKAYASAIEKIVMRNFSIFAMDLKKIGINVFNYDTDHYTEEYLYNELYVTIKVDLSQYIDAQATELFGSFAARRAQCAENKEKTEQASKAWNDIKGSFAASMNGTIRDAAKAVDSFNKKESSHNMSAKMTETNAEKILEAAFNEALYSGRPSAQIAIVKFMDIDVGTPDECIDYADSACDNLAAEINDSPAFRKISAACPQAGIIAYPIDDGVIGIALSFNNRSAMFRDWLISHDSSFDSFVGAYL